jgi:glutamine---fructose-6-phosphate transaminase (isomerizing)
MCGIFGVYTKRGAKYSATQLIHLLERIALCSESRGKDSSGMVFRSEDESRITVIRGALPISRLFREDAFSKKLNSVIKASSFEGNHNDGFAAMGHARLVTNGSQLRDCNNQPSVKEGIVGVHNGIIVNVDELWAKYQDIRREYEIDTEVFLAIVRRRLEKGAGSCESVAEAVKEVFGTASVGLMFNDRAELVLATNNGSLYILTNYDDILVFASEGFMLKLLLEDKRLQGILEGCSITQVPPNAGYILDLSNFSLRKFNFEETFKPQDSKLKKTLDIIIKEVEAKDGQIPFVVDEESIRSNPKAGSEKELLENNIDRIRKLRRCTRCLLPETFPFIRFGENGVCNYCNNYTPRNKPKPLEELLRLVEPYKSKTGEPDVIIPFSGGRDSTFTLHMAKNVLGLNPIAYTYDWGMVTDLARRNIARVTGKLGVENIIVAADIRRKRENIRRNIQAWLKRPNLGVIPLFMAGDKYFFYYCNQVKKQMGIRLNLWGMNSLEYTHFKTGFAGLRPHFTKKYVWNLTAPNHLRLFSFIGKTILANPAYLNRSVWDTGGSYVVRYLFPRRDYYRFFDYYQWEENKIENCITKEYGWETAKDTFTTWRVGDGTAGFYNYVYYTVAGFSEIDTFRSNQIREGMLTRDEGMALAEKENIPRYETIKWYLDILGLDYKDSIKRINEIPRLYA